MSHDRQRPRGRPRGGYEFRRLTDDEPSPSDGGEPADDGRYGGRPTPYPRGRAGAPANDDEEAVTDLGFDPVVGDEFDEPHRFDISSYREGLFGGPGADLIGDSELGDAYEPDPALIAEQEIPPARHGQHEHSAPPAEPAETSGSLVRPYTRTGGRTRPDYDLAIEALVSTSARGMRSDVTFPPEHQSICGLCTDARSVAEVAAHLRLPLGVARVLIGDLASLGLVMVHQSTAVVGDRPSREFLERVLSGLRRL
ncbi:MAG: DUF742 domain-containing protein [Sciscionella sp.]